jgi:Tol biopolymer transport system component
LSADPIRVWDTGYRYLESPELYRVDLWTHDWSPDETKIVYTKRNATMYVADLGTGSESYLTLTAGCNPRWSPDGTKIVFLELYLSVWYGGLGTIRPDGTDEQIIVERSSKGSTTKNVHEIPDWSPDSKYLVYAWFVGKKGPSGGYFIYIVEANGDNPTCLTDDISNSQKMSHTWR